MKSLLCNFFPDFSLFETYPDVQSSFRPFNGMILEDLKKSKQLRAHALR